MRRVLLMCALTTALVAPASAFATATAPDDGTLAIRNASSDAGQIVVSLNVTGAVIGQFDSGRLVIDEAGSTEAVAAVVTGADRGPRDLPSGATLYAGSDVRFRAVGGHYKIRIYGRGIDVNVVGQGLARLTGSPALLSDGRYSLNGGSWTSLPDFAETLRIGG